MLNHAHDDPAHHRPALFSRRDFLRAIRLAFTRSFHPLAVGFTAIGDDLVWLLRWCAFGGAVRYAGAGQEVAPLGPLSMSAILRPAL